MIAFPLIYSAYLGVAEGARDSALETARRKPANAGLIELTGEMPNAFCTAETVLNAMIATAQSATPGPETTSAVMTGRTVAGRAAIRTAELAVEVSGGGAFYKGSIVERAFRDLQAARFHPLQEPAQRELSQRLARSGSTSTASAPSRLFGSYQRIAGRMSARHSPCNLARDRAGEWPVFRALLDGPPRR